MYIFFLGFGLFFPENQKRGGVDERTIGKYIIRMLLGGKWDGSLLGNRDIDKKVVLLLFISYYLL